MKGVVGSNDSWARCVGEGMMFSHLVEIVNFSYPGLLMNATSHIWTLSGPAFPLFLLCNSKFVLPLDMVVQRQEDL